MLTQNINFKNFKNVINVKKVKKVKKLFKNLLKDQPLLFETLKPNYKYSYSKRILSKDRRFFNIRII